MASDLHGNYLSKNSKLNDWLVEYGAHAKHGLTKILSPLLTCADKHECNILCFCLIDVQAFMKMLKEVQFRKAWKVNSE